MSKTRFERTITTIEVDPPKQRCPKIRGLEAPKLQVQLQGAKGCLRLTMVSRIYVGCSRFIMFLALEVYI